MNKGSTITKRKHWKKIKENELTLSLIKSCYKDIVIKMCCTGRRIHRYISVNRTGSLETAMCVYEKLTYGRSGFQVNGER